MKSESRNHRSNKKRHTQFEGLGLPTAFHSLENLGEQLSPWHETEAEVRQALRRGREKAAKLQWIRTRMVFDLTDFERHCLTLHYFQGLSYRQAGTILGASASTVCRHANRGVSKLRQAAKYSKFIKK